MKLILFTLTGLLIISNNNFLASDPKAMRQRNREASAQTMGTKSITTQLVQSNNNYLPFIPAPETATPVSLRSN